MSNRLLIVIFIFILALPSLDNLFKIAPIKQLFEKRTAATMPKLPQNIAQLKEFPEKFEAFYNDNYGFRKSLVLLNSKIMDDIFNESPDARAVIGKNDWLYFDNHNSLLDAMGQAIISDIQIDKLVNSFGKNWQKMRQANIDYLLVIAADKSSIYPEFLPKYIKVKKQHRIDKFILALKHKYPDFPIIDLRPILLKAKKNEIIYHKTDTHWNRRGAHYAYVEIINKLAVKYPNLKPNLRNKFKDKSDHMINGDIAQIMNSKAQNIDYNLEPNFVKKYYYNVKISNKYRQKYHKAKLFNNIDKSLPRIFIYKDSFFDNLDAFIAQHFSYSLLINEFPCDLDYNIIKQHNPDIVIQQFWESRISSIANKCSSN